MDGMRQSIAIAKKTQVFVGNHGKISINERDVDESPQKTVSRGILWIDLRELDRPPTKPSVGVPPFSLLECHEIEF